MPTLFQIGDDLKALSDLLDAVGGDVSEADVEAAVTAWFAELADAEAIKLDSYVGLIRVLEEEKVAAEEAARLLTVARCRANGAARLKGRLRDHLLATGRTSAKTALGRTVCVQANGGVVPVIVDDVPAAELPERFRVTTVVADRRAIGEALADGESLPFARPGSGDALRVR